MNSIAVRANCLDASALVKLYVKENGSDILEGYLQNQATRYTTLLCFYEALTVLKVKWLYKKDPKDSITRDQYLEAAYSMSAWFTHVSRRYKDLDFLSHDVFHNARSIAERYCVDLSDAFQILSVKEGCFSGLAGDSKTLLVTADKKLAVVAKKEGICAWYILGEPAP
jgi:predicted nucleic acid-binding protein